MRVVLAGQRSFGVAVLELLRGRGLEVVQVAAPVGDRLHERARTRGIPTVARLTAELLEPRVDLIVAAHSHDFIGRRTRLATTFGAIGYHPSLLPLHRGRSAVEWTVRDRDRLTGGTVYWLDDRMDGGPIAAQDWCFVRPEWSASDLWREELFPMGLRLLARTLGDIERDVVVAVPQDEALATFEPAMDPPRVARPDLPELTDGRGVRYSVRVDREALR